jgi:predicted membrane-bound spermidine synthase
MRRPPSTLLLHAGVFLITFSGLMFEIGLTRIFSATIWYHFAFVAISVALLGWGLGGFALHLLRDRLPPSLDRAAALAVLYAAAIPLCLWLIVAFPFHPSRLPFYFAVSLLPFLLAGSALAMVFDLHRRTAGRLYFADLVGASTGALAVTFLLSRLGAEGAVLSVSLAALAGAACLSRRAVPVALAGAVLVIAALAMHGQTGVFRIRSAPTKGMYRHMQAEPAARVDQTGWNAYSRIDAVTGFAGSLARLYIDSDAWTDVHRWDGQVESLADAARWFRALPFRVVPKGETLVIGPGGGSDVLVALASGHRVTAVELNPLVLRFVRRYGDAAGNLYDHPLVETHLSEGRTFLARTERRFDVIFLGFVDSWASVASGGLSLSENYLYTTGGFRAYLDHLTGDGALVIMRWRTDVPRLLANAVSLLGPLEAKRRVAVVMERGGTPDAPPQMIFMLRSRAFTPAEAADVMAWPGAVPVIVPGHVPGPADAAALLAGEMSLAAYDGQGRERAGPVTDDRPFFFARSRPLGMHGGMLLAFAEILLPIGVLSAVLVRRGRPRTADAGGYKASIVYFSCLGLGFMAVELSLLQSLTLLVGHPVFTLSLLLFTILAAGGAGAWASGRFAMPRVCLAVALVSAVYAFVLPAAVPALLPLSLSARIAIAVAVVAPLGFAMGMPFPSGLRRAGRGSLQPAPFYWGLNGVLSVVGSIGTMVLAVNLGFKAAMIAGSLCYVGAALAAPRVTAAGDEEQERAA